jgi:tRNA-dihydrouridine synthase B
MPPTLSSPPVDFPLFLAPMAGVTDLIFRQLCKEYGADVLTTEFVSADGILHRNERTADFVEFDPALERPLGVQLFGGDPQKLAEAARAVIDWVNPDFIDLNFGCPVNKVVSKNGGSSLLRDCPLLEKVALAVVQAVGHSHPRIPVTAKIRIGWDDQSINAPKVARLLEGCGIQRLAVHGRTKAQGYSGVANWDVIAEVAAAVEIPVIGNGDIATAEDVRLRRDTAGVAGVMIGRAAMNGPWLFSQAKTYLRTGELLPEPPLAARWETILRHCRLAVASRRRGGERAAMASMRARLMAYTRGMNGSRLLRGTLSHVASVLELEEIAGRHLAACEEQGSDLLPLGA